MVQFMRHLKKRSSSRERIAHSVCTHTHINVRVGGHMLLYLAARGETQSREFSLAQMCESKSLTNIKIMDRSLAAASSPRQW